jgi:hypothetical protein
MLTVLIAYLVKLLRTPYLGILPFHFLGAAFRLIVSQRGNAETLRIFVFRLPVFCV